MELGYGVLLDQKQQLSQSQIRSLEILAMDGLELNRFLQNEYLENPLLDCSENGSIKSGTEEINKRYEHTITYGRNYEEMVEADDKRRQDIPMPEQGEIKSYLLNQLVMSQYKEREWYLLEYLIDCLEDTGFFTMPVWEVAQATGMPEAAVGRFLHLLRGLEPYGIFASDLKHCLLKQLEMAGQKGADVWRVVEEHLEDVAAGRISTISRSLKLSTVQVRQCIEQIAKLNPRPMNEFVKERADYIVPDIIFRRERGGWEVELNDDWVEDYHINDYYLRMMKESQDEELSGYFRMKLERVRFVMNSIAQRRQTILSISREVLKRQVGYLEGNAYLQPMTMASVAEALGIHTSTVSRAIKGKYIQYPGGTILLKQLFAATVTTNQQNMSVGTMEIKQLIVKLIAGEDKKKPYSDKALLELLEKKGIEISRRAVAKYREELGIKGSFARKEG